MNILGIFLIFLMPFLTGIVFNFITVQKRTNQIETYLIGFFSFFLIQGVIFSLYNFVNVPFEICCEIFTGIMCLMGAMSILVAIIRFKDYIAWDIKKLAPKKEEYLPLGIMLLATLVVIIRILSLYNYERDDLVLETVRINVLTNTVNTYNPLTGRMFELGMITSKKVVTLPLYYTYWCENFSIDPRLLIYGVCILQTLMCVLMASRCVMTAVIKSRRKRLLCLFFVSVLLASGDYFKGAIGYKVIWNGYDGATIVAAVMIAYIIFLIMDIYRLERGDYGKAGWGGRIVRVLKLLICLACTLFITSIPTGLLMIVLCLVSMIICATLRFGREEKA